jgi:hypothetical protein
VRRLFADEAERVEAIRLLDLASWNRRKKTDDSNRTTDTPIG